MVSRASLFGCAAGLLVLLSVAMVASEPHYDGLDERVCGQRMLKNPAKTPTSRKFEKRSTGRLAQQRAGQKGRTKLRLAGGYVAKQHSYPWFVALSSESSVGQSFTPMCAGTILHRNVIITTAACAQEAKRSGKQVNVFAGLSKLANQTAVQSVPVANWCYSEKFNESAPIESGARRDNVAVGVLSKDLTYNEAVQPACFDNTPQQSKRSNKIKQRDYYDEQEEEGEEEGEDEESGESDEYVNEDEGQDYQHEDESEYDEPESPFDSCFFAGLGKTKYNPDQSSESIKAFPIFECDSERAQLAADESCFETDDYFEDELGKACRGDLGGAVYCYKHHNTNAYYAIGLASHLVGHDDCNADEDTRTALTSLNVGAENLAKLLHSCAPTAAKPTSVKPKTRARHTHNHD